MVRYLEDFQVGEVIDLGSVTVSEEDILAFARQFDPQPFHVDHEAAQGSIYGGLIASGWHTCGIYMRLLADNFLRDTISMGSPGIDTLRWSSPVRPGDTLRARLTILDVTPSRSRPDRGTMRLRGEVLNERDEVVMSLEPIGIFGRRPG